MDLSVIVPTFNEGPNVAELVRRTAAALVGREVEVVFVDDSTDDTPDVIRAVAAASDIPVRLIHRDDPVGGLGGAVVEGIRAAASDRCVVMDGDLQHPPEVIADLLARAEVGDADVVVASRYTAGGTSDGLANAVRTTVSRASTLLTKAMFPKKLHNCSDPMTGFFLVERTSLDIDTLQPRGFKILLEILARKQMRVAEVPFSFAPRFAGESKASFNQGMRFLLQLTMLRFGRMSAFALVGGLGAVANLAIMWALTTVGVQYIVAAIIASVITIVANFLALEYLVFADMREESGLMRHRFIKSFTFNGVEAIVRIPVIWLLVNQAHIQSVVAAALTLIAAFVVRFVFHALVVYAPKKSRVGKAVRAIEPLEDEVTA
ncbi:glycosyltransferase family 2 protein [Microbacterium sp. PRF11]|uniref:glycosyltransferase family 2 protein n=1 Tax=Microbacterium sp. PRF11 TaxID=2962593 RepID=UPI00288157B0|nr:glycosyltransferase family 2 protein [Microbacterium sp. PRF11]MDT0116887.1 glycosyltransferase family 2 protein [Microbacterium sp. PRF11]